MTLWRPRTAQVSVMVLVSPYRAAFLSLKLLSLLILSGSNYHDLVNPTHSSDNTNMPTYIGYVYNPINVVLNKFFTKVVVRSQWPLDHPVVVSSLTHSVCYSLSFRDSLCHSIYPRISLRVIYLARVIKQISKKKLLHNLTCKSLNNIGCYYF